MLTNGKQNGAKQKKLKKNEGRCKKIPERIIFVQYLQKPKENFVKLFRKFFYKFFENYCNFIKNNV